MDLKKRLARLDKLGKSSHPGSASATAAREFDPVPLLAGLGLDLQTNAEGEFWVREVRHDQPVRADKLPSLVGFFSHAQPPWPDPRQILFLDTETTGLAGGTGTLPFLVGVAWWQGRTFRTRQYFLAGPHQEAAMLLELSRLGKSFQVVMSFNGASFDLPLLRTRFVMNRLRPGLESLQSWDLLVPVRRLWGRTLADCRQQTLEAAVCGLKRGSQDIPGHLIPAAWFDFLREGRSDAMDQVLYHNQQDLLGMAAIFDQIVQMARDRIGDPQASDRLGWREAWSLGRICEARGETTLAGLWLGRAWRQASCGRGPAMAEPIFIRDVLRICKRAASWTLVAKVIQGALDKGLRETWLHREAAILYEHRLQDFQSALDHALLTGEDIRIRRLRRRLARVQAGD